jgi:hypothetical protein
LAWIGRYAHRVGVFRSIVIDHTHAMLLQSLQAVYPGT